MKTIKSTLGFILALISSYNLTAQDNNLVINGSFETGDTKVVRSFHCLDSISSSNNTTVDLFSKNSRMFSPYGVPENQWGTQESKTGDNYAGIIAYYADDAGLFKTKPGYRQYSEYIQFALREPLVAGKAYAFTFNASLAENSAYAVSGLGFYASKVKLDVENNSFLELTPQGVSPYILEDKGWTQFTTIYVATGGERYITLGCFENYMYPKKVIPDNVNNNRKAYYYIDDVGMAPYTPPVEEDHITGLLLEQCFRLEDLNFELDKAVILPESFGELDSLADFLKRYPYVNVYIDGHTDKTGTHEHNDGLSIERAEAVKKYLVDRGVGGQLQTRGYGETRPIDLENENSFENRRVEITICQDEE